MDGKYQIIIDFFKSMELYDRNFFNYIKKKTKVLDLPYEEIKDFVGCFPVIVDDKVVDFNILLPKLNTIFDVLVYIHEYSHAIDIYDENEIFPNLMEAMFLVDYLQDDELITQQINRIYEELKNNESERHEIGKKVKLNKIKQHFYLN